MENYDSKCTETLQREIKVMHKDDEEDTEQKQIELEKKNYKLIFRMNRKIQI